MGLFSLNNWKNLYIILDFDPSFTWRFLVKIEKSWHDDPPIAKSISLVSNQSDCSASPMSLHELDTMMSHHENEITIFRNHEVSSMSGNGHLQEVILRNIDDNNVVNIQANAMIICSERIPNSELASKLGCDLDKDGFVRVTRDQKTEVTGTFAAGDVTGVILTAIKSAGEGCVAGMKAAEYIKTGIW